MHKNKEEYNAYMRKYMLERYYRRKAEAIVALGGKCANCGSVDKLEIDHKLRVGKNFVVTDALASWSEERIQKELKLCQLLCNKCHSEKSLQEVGRVSAKTTHGTLSSYRYCRCDLCKKAKSDYLKEHRKKNPR